MTALDAEPNATVEYKLNLENGGAQVDMTWAALSSVALVPATRFEHFAGAHRFFTVELPPKSTLTVRIAFAAGCGELNLYGMNFGAGAAELPPHVTSCVSSEAQYPMHAPGVDAVETYERSIELRSVTHPYTALIGVCGAIGVVNGEFTLGCELKSAIETPLLPDGAVPPPVAVSVEANLETPAPPLPFCLEEGGVRINMEWAAESNIALVPATRFEHFAGAHRFFTVELPPKSTLTARLSTRRQSTATAVGGGGAATATGAKMMQGFLKKKGAGADAAFKRRWFTCTEGSKQLKYFSDRLAELSILNLKGSIFLGDTTRLEIVGNTITIHTASRVWELKVDGTSEAAQWVRMIETESGVIANAKEGSASPPAAVAAAAVVVVATVPAIPPPRESECGELNLYGMSFGAGTFELPPHVRMCVSSSAHYPMHAPGVAAPAETRERAVTFNSIVHAYTVLIGVCGATDVAHGDFTLSFDLVSEVEAPKVEVPPPGAITVAPGDGPVTITSSIEEGGVQIPMAWAANSSVAVAPATRHDRFDGPHRFFTVELPSNTNIEITLNATAQGLSLYTMTFGHGAVVVPPDTTQCVQSFASYGETWPRVIKAMALRNPYSLLIGVCGACGAMTGNFTLTFELTAR